MSGRRRQADRDLLLERAPTVYLEVPPTDSARLGQTQRDPDGQNVTRTESAWLRKT
jgi:hypothetical protein